MLYGYLYHNHERPMETTVVAHAEEETIPYQGNVYERSDVKFTHLSLKKYLGDRDKKLSDQLAALVTNMPAGTFIAGGAVAAAVNAPPAFAHGKGILAPADIDLFFDSEQTYETALKMLSFAYKEMKGDRVPEGVRMFEHPIAGYLNVQAINIAWFPDGIEAVLDGFDFTVTHFGIDVAKDELVFNPLAPLDYANGLLLNHRYEGDTSSKKRLAKYITKGFLPVGETLTRAYKFGLIKE